MKAKLLTIAVCFGLFIASSSALFAKTEKIIIRFDYAQQSGEATNQYAVWIEDTNGNVVKPIFVTNFTGNGGWGNTPETLPDWVNRVVLGTTVDTMSGSTMQARTTDALSGSTPQSGKLEYIWDRTDTNGNIVPNGTYIFFVEASFRWENRVLFAGIIELDGDSFSVQASPEYFGTDRTAHKMIQNVTARYIQ